MLITSQSCHKSHARCVVTVCPDSFSKASHTVLNLHGGNGVYCQIWWGSALTSLPFICTKCRPTTLGNMIPMFAINIVKQNICYAHICLLHTRTATCVYTTYLLISSDGNLHILLKHMNPVHTYIRIVREKIRTSPNQPRHRKIFSMRISGP